jgi:membrane-associated protein
MHEIIDNLKHFINPEWIIAHGGIWVMLFIVFAETGLFAGFFLPGDSLLFVTGIYAHEIENSSTHIMEPGLGYQLLRYLNFEALHYSFWYDLFVLIVFVTFAGILGNSLGYWTGKKFGTKMFNWKDRFLFKKKYLHDAHDFYEKHGGSAVVFARFLPIIRTFAPIIAGLVGMNKSKFVFFNVIGCIAWVTSMILAGHFLQKLCIEYFNFDLKSHLEIIVIGIIFITTAPVLWKLFFGKSKVQH